MGSRIHRYLLEVYPLRFALMVSPPLVPHSPLQYLYDLDKASPQFHERLRNFLHGNEYQNVLPSLQSESLALLVEYLDRVCLTTRPSPRYAQYLCRFSLVFPITQAPYSRNRYWNLEMYVASKKCYRNPACFQNHSWDVFMRAHLTVQRCALDA